jgi:Organic solvent tolerance protein OstA
MRRCYFTAALAWFVWVACAMGQFGSFGDVPVSITADGNTRFEGGVAIAEDNVQIHYGDYSIYCDYAEYNPDTRDVLLIGNIRLYTPKEMLTGQRALFNLETKQMRALEFSGQHFPLLFHAFNLRAPSLREFRVRDATFTTDDSSQPNFSCRIQKRSNLSRQPRHFFPVNGLYRPSPVFWFRTFSRTSTIPGLVFCPGSTLHGAPFCNWPTAFRSAQAIT